MMVVPVDPDEREAQKVDQQRREPVAQGGETSPGRRPQLKGHDGDDHREHAVAEGFHTGGLGLGRAYPAVAAVIIAEP
jgi:hypothetical protein